MPSTTGPNLQTERVLSRQDCHHLQRNVESQRQGKLFLRLWQCALLIFAQSPDESLDSWLFPPGAEDADIYAIAFQEIVVLNAQQILQTDPAKR